MTPNVKRLPRREPTDAMAHIDPMDAARALRRAVVHREDHRVTLTQRHYFYARLRTRPLLRQHNSPPSKSSPGDDSSTVACSGNTCSTV